MRHLAATLLLAVTLGWTAVAHAAEPTWSGDIAVRKCARVPRALPDGVLDTMAGAVEITAGYSSGTGFLISSDGYILTAAHVVRGFDRVDVRVGGQKTTQATVLRISTERDVALLYVGGSALPCLPEARTDATVGSDLWVIGAPRGDEAFSVMRGVVSATRTVAGARLLQTDAAVNPGDSGGAMVDSAGRARAIVSFKVSGALYEGIGFGVPISVALDALDLDLGDHSEADPLAKAGARVNAPVAPSAPLDPAASAAVNDRFKRLAKERSEKKRRIAMGLAIGGGGAVLAGGGMYFGSLGRYLGARNLPDTDPKSIDLKEWRTLQGVSATGISLAGVGAVLTLVGALQWRALPANVTIVPSIGGFQVAGVLP